MAHVLGLHHMACGADACAHSWCAGHPLLAPRGTQDRSLPVPCSMRTRSLPAPRDMQYYSLPAPCGMQYRLMPAPHSMQCCRLCLPMAYAVLPPLWLPMAYAVLPPLWLPMAYAVLPLLWLPMAYAVLPPLWLPMAYAVLHVYFVRAGALPGASAAPACVLAIRLACTHNTAQPLPLTMPPSPSGHRRGALTPTRSPVSH